MTNANEAKSLNTNDIMIKAHFREKGKFETLVMMEYKKAQLK